MRWHLKTPYPKPAGDRRKLFTKKILSGTGEPPNYSLRLAQLQTGGNLSMKTQQALFVLVIALVALFLVGCGPVSVTLPGTGDGETPAPPDQLPGAVLEAQNWLAERLSLTVDQLEIVSFEQVDWTDSCLGLGGPAESCLQAITPGYQVIVRAGGQEYEVRTDETGMAIRSPQFPSMPGEATPLDGTQWTLTAFSEAGSETAVIEGTELTLEFQEGGQAVGTGGCNQFGAPYSVTDSRLNIVEVVTTEIACPGEGVMEQEQRYYQALQSAGEFEMVGDELRITYGDGQGTLIFNRAGSM
jgi:heat shock protein HslJ